MKIKQLAHHFYLSSLGISVEIAYALILIFTAFIISYLLAAVK